MPIIVSPVDPWSPYVHGTPADAYVYVDQNRILAPFDGVCGIPTKIVEGEERFWNGVDFVSFEAAGLDVPATITLPPGATAGDMPKFRQWRILMPWSTIGNGFYSVRVFKNSGNDGYWFQYPWATRHIEVRGASSPNPTGVAVGSSFGGTDALRILDPQNAPIAGATIEARYFYDDTSYWTRATATSDSNGRWTFDRVLQPEIEHAIRVYKSGRVTATTTITTGEAA